ncbi:hypothetical protein ACFWFI_02650 [Streptomyces sp. NPDC060209]|uniref:hypothetical protein n=1 Tax=Streptomyces sp. NPDC060209 TaxID=3347073 RepID=UPI00364B44A2
MTPHITEFLSRARLVTTPYTQQDIDAAEARLHARLHATATPPPPAPAVTPEEPTEQEAAQNLNTLCQTVVTRKSALSTLDTFLTPQLPEPPGARVLGCILQLAESEENARFWWQYAAGAGDPAASYCLYLHHLALGEHGEADWWHEQTERIQGALPWSDDSTDAEPHIKNDVSDAVTDALHAVSTTDASLLPTALRILNALKTEPAPVPALVGAVLDYVPAAVGPIDDFELPLPAPGFTDHIRTLTKTASAPAPSRPRVRNRLQTRPKNPNSLIASARRHPNWCWG